MNPLTTYSTEAVEVLQLVYDNLIALRLRAQARAGLATSWTYSSGRQDDHLQAAVGDLARRQAVHLRGRQVHLRRDPVQAGQPVRAVGHRPDLDRGPRRVHAGAALLPAAGVQPGPGRPDPARSTSGQSMSAADIQKFANAKPVGTGPYKFVNWKHGQSIEIARNDGWWGTKPAARQDHLDPVPERRRDGAEPAHRRGRHLPGDPADDLGRAEGRAERQDRVDAVVLVPPHRDQRLRQPEVRREPAAQGPARFGTR